MSTIDTYNLMVYDKPMDEVIKNFVFYMNDTFEDCRLTVGYDNEFNLFEIEIIDHNDIPLYVALGRTLEEAIQELYEKIED